MHIRGQCEQVLYHCSAHQVALTAIANGRESRAGGHPGRDAVTWSECGRNCRHSAALLACEGPQGVWYEQAAKVGYRPMLYSCYGGHMRVVLAASAATASINAVASSINQTTCWQGGCDSVHICIARVWQWIRYTEQQQSRKHPGTLCTCRLTKVQIVIPQLELARRQAAHTIQRSNSSNRAPHMRGACHTGSVG